MSYLTGATYHKYTAPNSLQLTAIFKASPIKKTLFSSSFYQSGVGFVGGFFCEVVDRQKSCRFNTKIFSDCWRYKPGFYFFSPCIRYNWVNSIDWSTKLSLTRQGLIYKNLFHQLGKIRTSSLEHHSNISVFNLCVNCG